MSLADGLAVMSVDLGSQFMKIAIVKVAKFILHQNLLQHYMYLGLIF